MRLGILAMGMLLGGVVVDKVGPAVDPAADALRKIWEAPVDQSQWSLSPWMQSEIRRICREEHYKIEREDFEAYCAQPHVNCVNVDALEIEIQGK